MYLVFSNGRNLAIHTFWKKYSWKMGYHYLKVLWWGKNITQKTMLRYLNVDTVIWNTPSLIHLQSCLLTSKILFLLNLVSVTLHCYDYVEATKYLRRSLIEYLTGFLSNFYQLRRSSVGTQTESASSKSNLE